MDKEAIRLLAQIGAMKLLLGRAYTFLYTLAKISPDNVRQIHMTMIASLPHQSLVATSDPALSDLFSAEIESELRSLLQGIEAEFEKGPKAGPSGLFP